MHDLTPGRMAMVDEPQFAGMKFLTESVCSCNAIRDAVFREKDGRSIKLRSIDGQILAMELQDQFPYSDDFVEWLESDSGIFSIVAKDQNNHAIQSADYIRMRPATTHLMEVESVKGPSKKAIVIHQFSREADRTEYLHVEFCQGVFQIWWGFAVTPESVRAI